MDLYELNLKEPILFKIDDHLKNKNEKIINLKGIINSFNCEILIKYLGELSIENNETIIFNCKELNYMSISAVGTLLGFINKNKIHAENIYFFEVCPDIEKLFKILGLKACFKILT
jgi:anti-anti-sigma factor